MEDDSTLHAPERETAPVTPASGARVDDGYRPGDVVDGKYRLGELLGAGGMGTVFEATHLGLGEAVAIKLVAVAGSDKAERLRREARIALRIKGEHVVRAMDVGTLPSGAPYVVMERLVGEDLAKVLRTRGPLPVDDAVDYVLQACVAMAEAHALGVVHRDLKPSNLFLTRRADGSPLVKVLDFGIAKTHAMTAADGSPLASLTLSTSILGSPQYMAPEQVRAAKDIDARADVWALGVILHELCAGAPPFSGNGPSAVLAAIAADPPEPLATQRPDAPEGIAEAVARCLEKDPARRMPSVAALAEALAPFAPERSRIALERIAGIGATMASPRTGDAASAAVATASSAAPLAGAPPPDEALSVTIGDGIAPVRGLRYAAAASVALMAGAGLFWLRHATSETVPSPRAKTPVTALASASSAPPAPDVRSPAPAQAGPSVQSPVPGATDATASGAPTGPPLDLERKAHPPSPGSTPVVHRRPHVAPLPSAVPSSDVPDIESATRDRH